jgi:predicted nuclease of predicted toxin-antitoxin system
VKLLLDSCVWGGTLTRLRAAGHDVVWSGEWPADPGDEEILARALAEGRVLVTLDKDFGELAVVRELPHAGIVRLVGLSALQQAEVTL